MTEKPENPRVFLAKVKQLAEQVTDLEEHVDTCIRVQFPQHKDECSCGYLLGLEVLRMLRAREVEGE